MDNNKPRKIVVLNILLTFVFWLLFSAEFVYLSILLIRTDFMEKVTTIGLDVVYIMYSVSVLTLATAFTIFLRYRNKSIRIIYLVISSLVLACFAMLHLSGLVFGRSS